VTHPEPSRPWHRFSEYALAKAADRRTAVESAVAFLAFKARIVSTVRGKIDHLLASTTSSATIEQESVGGGLNRVVLSNVTSDEEAEFTLQMLLDVFLFESASLEAALLQLVNVTFGLGVDARDIGLAQVVPLLERHAEAHARPTPLAYWRAQRSNRDSWLWWLFELRNEATHRRLLELKPFMPSIHIGPDAPTTGRVRMEYWLPMHAGGHEPLAAFMERTAVRIQGLLDQSFDELSDLLYAMTLRSS
jgi:hypothetical protein